MWSKFFFERFWESEQRNELFVCMPFHHEFDERFSSIVDPSARGAGFDKATRVDQSTEGNVVTDKIWNGIANSKMVLVDLTDDPKSNGHVNGNVLLELGAAQAMREPSSVVIIRDQNPREADFDVRGLTINQPPGGNLTKEWLVDLLAGSVKNHDWAQSKRVKAAAESLDEIGLMLMWEIGRRPTDWRHFNTVGLPAEVKMAVLRLMDLGILRLGTGGPQFPTEHAYHWTPFGNQVMRYLGINMMTLAEFEKTPQYPAAVGAREKWAEAHKKMEEAIRASQQKPTGD